MAHKRKRSYSFPDLCGIKAKKFQHMEYENDRESSVFYIIQALHEEMQKLKKGMDSLRKQTSQDIQAMRKENNELRETVGTLSKELEKLKETNKRDRATDFLSSLANVFQMAICWYVLPEIYYDDKLTASVQELHDYIHGVKDLPTWLVELVDESEYKQRWEKVCHTLSWPMRWEAQNPPSDLKMITDDLSSGRKWVVLPHPIKIDEMGEMIEELNGWPQQKKNSIKRFITEFESKLTRCGLKYDHQQYYMCE